MRKLLLGLLLLFPSVAHAGQPGAPHQLRVQADRPCTLRWTVVGAGAAESTFVDDREDVSHLIEVHRGSDGRLPRIELEAAASGGFFTSYNARWTGHPKELRYEQTSGLDEDVLQLSLKPATLWPRVWGLTGALAIALASWLWLSRRSMRRHLQRADETLRATRAQLSEAQLQQGLFPADGSLPRRIGDYTVLSRLGAGGMAVVYLVENSRGEKYALKLPLPTCLQDDEYKRRFRRELRIGVRLLHPSLVRIIDVNGGQEGDRYPYPFLVMEWVRGQTLQEYIKKGIGLTEILAITSQVLDALDYIHRNGVIHRDIKPSNVMLTGGKGRVRLMDFGVAHHNDTVNRLTGSGDVLGTAAYMAPEQIDGSPVDGRTDLYALGVMVYEMLAGRLPYGNDPMQVLYQKLHEDLPPLRDASPQVPAAVEQWLTGLIARQPDQRWASASEAREALRQVRPL